MAVDFTALAVQMTTVGNIASAARVWTEGMLPPTSSGIGRFEVEVSPVGDPSAIDDFTDEAATLVTDLTALRDAEDDPLVRADLTACVDLATAAQAAIDAIVPPEE